jgi:hypothetical protein
MFFSISSSSSAEDDASGLDDEEEEEEEEEEQDFEDAGGKLQGQDARGGATSKKVGKAGKSKELDSRTIKHVAGTITGVARDEARLKLLENMTSDLMNESDWYGYGTRSRGWLQVDELGWSAGEPAVEAPTSWQTARHFLGDEGKRACIMWVQTWSCLVLRCCQS